MDLFELLIALAVILFGLLGGGKKKKVPPARPRPAPRPSATKPTPQPKPTPMPGASTPVYSYDETHDGEVVSLETLEPAGEASHVRFHEKYSSPLTLPVSGARRPIRPPGGVRSAIVWSEILGPPKSLT
ncbi:MAG: hypothetical protein WD934_10730 [Gemmatimonadales bacterium]